MSATDRPASSRPSARVAKWVALALAFGVALEGTARVEDRVRFGTPFLSPYRSQSDLIVRDRDGMHGRPGARYQKWVMNQLGMRGPEASVAKAPGTLRIVTSGASETFGLFESPGREYPRQLEDSLEAAREGGRCACEGIARFEVLNAAMLGMTMPTAIQDVRNRLGRLSPDVVLYYPHPTQYLWETPPQAAPPDSSAQREPGLREALHPRMAERLRNQAKGMVPQFVQTRLREWEARRQVGDGILFDGLPPERLALFEADLRTLVGAVRAIGAEPVLVTHANAFTPGAPIDRELMSRWLKFYPRASARALLAFDSASRVVTLRVAADSAASVVDLQRVMHARDDAVFADGSHFSDLGAAVSAGEIGRAVLARRRAGATSPAATPAAAPARTD
jgi:hypothetical protein